MMKLKYFLSTPNLIIAATCLLVTIGIFSPDTLYVGGVPPWDASFYMDLAKHFPYLFINHQIGPYGIQRILPSVIIYNLLTLFKIAPTDIHVIYAFGLLNAACLTIISCLWYFICVQLDISNKGKWLGAVFLFINFAVLKHRTYDPVLTDSFAFFIGTLLFYCYLCRNQPALFLISFFGAFVWPTALYEGMILFLLPRNIQTQFTSQAEGKKNSLGILLPFILAAGSGCFILFLRHINFSTALPAYWPAFYLSLTLTITYLLAVSRIWILRLNNQLILQLRHFIFRKQYLSLCAAALSLTLIVKGIQHHFSTPTIGIDYPITQFLRVTFWVSILYPAGFYISHVMYFGPSFIFALFWWKRLVMLFYGWGIGIWACMGMAMLLALNGESRMLINFYPILVAGIIKIIDSMSWRSIHYIILILLSILVSKVWLTIGPIKMVEGPDVLLINQRLFMNNGPSMSMTSYAIQGFATLLLIGFIYIFYLKSRPRLNPSHERQRV